MADDRFLYFAYGSNMLTKRLRKRTPSAETAGTGFVPGYRLSFRKVGKGRLRNSGKCDLEATGKVEDRAYGVLFTILNSEAQALHDAEGAGYDKRTIDVVTADGTKTAVVYLANTTAPNLLPYDWYKAYVVAGAIQHGLPPAYVDWLRTFESQRDTDEERRTKEEATLAGD